MVFQFGLEITDLDPIEFRLIFDKFLNSDLVFDA